MKNHVVSLEISVARLVGPEQLKATGSMKVVTRGRVGRIDILQDNREMISSLPMGIQAKLSNVLQEIEDYLNSEPLPKKPGKAKPKRQEIRKEMEDEGFNNFDPDEEIELDPDDPAHNYIPGEEVDDPETR